MNHEGENAKIITLKDLWDIFKQKWMIMMLVAIISVIGVFTLHHFTFTPKYASTATLYILRQNESEAVQQADSDFSLALKVVNDCTYLLKSHAVVDEVIDRANLEIEYKDLQELITTRNPENTRILEVTVEADTPQNAKKIVDMLCEIGQKKIAEAMGFQQVNLYEYGTLEQEPSNHMRKMTVALFGILMAIVTYAVFLVKFLLDDRIHTDEDIEKYLHLSVLGNIPNADEERKHKKYAYYGTSLKSGTGKRSERK